MTTDVKTLSTGQLLEQTFSHRSERLKLEREAAILKEKEQAIADELISRKLKSGEYEGYLLSVRTTEEPVAFDWAAIVQFIKDTGSVDLLEKRLLKSGVKQRWDAGETVPGVSKVPKTAITVSEA